MKWYDKLLLSIMGIAGLVAFIALLSGCAPQPLPLYLERCPPPMELPERWVACADDTNTCVYERTFIRAYELREEVLKACHG